MRSPSFKLFYGKAVNGRMRIGFTGIENRIGEVGMVDGVGHLLRFKAECRLGVLRIATLQRMLGTL